MKLIPLSKGKAFAQVDDEDYDELMKFTWSVVTGPGKTKVQYAKRSKLVGGGRGIGRGKRIQIYMHKVLLPPPDGMLVDHKDRNGLNNQRDNLRLATYKQNSINCSRPNQKYRGIHWDKERQVFYTQVKIQRRKVILHGFETEIEAAVAYDSLANEYHGEFAVLNFSTEQPRPISYYDSRKDRSGENNSNNKFSDAQISEIIKRRTNGEKSTDLAKEFNISVGYISELVKGTKRKIKETNNGEE